MSKELLVKPDEMRALEKVLIKGDLAGLSEQQRITYVNALCKALKISPLFQPFDYVAFQGKMVLYAKRSCAEQLRNKFGISIRVINRERIDGLYVVTAQARTSSGREDEAIGAVNIKGLSGKELANSLMIAETKAKRRVTLSVCGLGILDETEVQQEATDIAREVNQAHAANISETISGTTSRPEFEQQGETQEGSSENVYTLKAGKNQGKKITQIPIKKLHEWMAWYSKKQSEDLHEDIHADAGEIHAYLAADKLQEETNGKN